MLWKMLFLAYQLSTMTLTAVPNMSTLFPASDIPGIDYFFPRNFVVKKYKGIEQ